MNKLRRSKLARCARKKQGNGAVDASVGSDSKRRSVLDIQASDSCAPEFECRECQQIKQTRKNNKNASAGGKKISSNARQAEKIESSGSRTVPRKISKQHDNCTQEQNSVGARLRPKHAGLTPPCTRNLSHESFSYGMHPPLYLIGVDTENSTSIHHPTCAKRIK